MFLQLGSELTEKTGSILAITFSNIQKIGIGFDEQPCELMPIRSVLRLTL